MLVFLNNKIMTDFQKEIEKKVSRKIKSLNKERSLLLLILSNHRKEILEDYKSKQSIIESEYKERLKEIKVETHVIIQNMRDKFIKEDEETLNNYRIKLKNRS